MGDARSYSVGGYAVELPEVADDGVVKSGEGHAMLRFMLAPNTEVLFLVPDPVTNGTADGFLASAMRSLNGQQETPLREKWMGLSFRGVRIAQSAKLSTHPNAFAEYYVYEAEREVVGVALWILGPVGADRDSPTGEEIDGLRRLTLTIVAKSIMRHSARPLTEKERERVANDVDLAVAGIDDLPTDQF